MPVLHAASLSAQVLLAWLSCSQLMEGAHPSTEGPFAGPAGRGPGARVKGRPSPQVSEHQDLACLLSMFPAGSSQQKGGREKSRRLQTCFSTHAMPPPPQEEPGSLLRVMCVLNQVSRHTAHSSQCFKGGLGNSSPDAEHTLLCVDSGLSPWALRKRVGNYN